MPRAGLFCTALAIWGLAAASPSPARAVGGVHVLSDDDAEHTMHAAHLEWPAGAIDLVHDDARVAAWHNWYSECPNDTYHYGFRCKSAKEVNHLIAMLARIEAKGLTVRLSPMRDGPTSMLYPDQPQYNVGFALGSQKMMNEWFARLPFEDETRQRRRWGIHRYTEPPTAMPPTLTICLGRTGITIRDLDIHEHIEVVADVGQQQRQSPENPALIREIDECVIARLKQRVARQQQELEATQCKLQEACAIALAQLPASRPAAQE